jgi:hypothetical protein
MSDYLLPCTCGKKLGVTKSQAGQTVRCACGKELEVPTLRGLSELERVGTRSAAQSRQWTNRHRVVFSLGVAALVGVLAAGYLAWELPPPLPKIEMVEVDETTPFVNLMAVYDELKKGLDGAVPPISAEMRAMEHEREMRLWGIRVAISAAGCAAVAAAAVQLSGGGRKR